MTFDDDDDVHILGLIPDLLMSAKERERVSERERVRGRRREREREEEKEREREREEEHLVLCDRKTSEEEKRLKFERKKI